MLRGSVGFILKDIFIAHRLSIDHFYRKQQGFPFSKILIDNLKSKGIRKIRLIVHRQAKSMEENGGQTEIYETFISNFNNVITFNEARQDEQVCLPLRLWDKLTD